MRVRMRLGLVKWQGALYGGKCAHRLPFDKSFKGNLLKSHIEAMLPWRDTSTTRLASQVTKAPKYSMTWLTMSDAKQLGLDVKPFGLSQDQWTWARIALARAKR